MTASAIQTAALAYYDAGASVIPVSTEATKHPLLKTWDSYKQARATREQTSGWFEANNRAIGVICGVVSGDREGIDIDNKPRPGYPDAEELINQMASMVDAEAPGLWDRLAIESSPSAGWHILYRCTALEGNQKLAMRPATDEDRAETKNPKLDRVTIIETRGEGGYFVSSPSPGYVVYQGDVANPPRITPEERAILFRAARALNLLQEQAEETTRPPHASGTALGDRPGDLYNADMSAEAVTQLLVSAGWHRCSVRRDGVIILRRPGKARGWSATMGYGGTNLLRVFSSNAWPFEPDKSYTPFAVRTLLEFDGNFTAATAALVDEGLFRYQAQTGPLRVDPPTVAPDIAQHKMPALPASATAIYDHLAPCGFWLDQYVAYAEQVSPTMVPEFHTLAGLFVVGTTVARRLCLRYRAGTLFPNLFGLFVAPSGYGKTTAFGALKAVAQACGISHLFLTEQMTPENLLSQMSTNLPSTLGNWEPAAQDLWLRERAFAAQRGWMLDESAFLFDSLTREYMTGLLGLLLKFYDCPATASRETQSGGRVLLNNISLSFFGASTTSNMRPHFQNEKWWSDGLWGRFAIVVPARSAVWVEDDEVTAIPVPLEVIQGLRHVFTMFGTPTAQLVEDEKKRTIEITGVSEPVDVILAPGVYTAWQIYRKAMAFDIGASAALDEPLRGSYSRFATHAMKVAMLLATMDATSADVTVSLTHYARGQQIAESWRVCMHQVWAQEMRIDERQLGDRALVKLRAVRPDGLTARQLQQQLNRTSREINDVLLLLQDAGLVVSGKAGRKVVWSVAS